MPEQRIILANGSRLLHEMLNRILPKIQDLKIVQEITDNKQLPAAIEEADAEWVIMFLPVDSTLPEWAEAYMVEHPRTRFMAVADDGSWVKTKEAEKHEEMRKNLSLRDLLHLLAGGALKPA